MFTYPNTNFSNKSFNLPKSFNWSNFLDKTSKTLNVINQAIPIVYQVKPIINNAKTMLKIANTINSDTLPNKNTTQEEKKEVTTSSNKPIFYL